MKLRDILTNTFINPFADDVDPAKLLNIASGVPVSAAVEKCLLGVNKKAIGLFAQFSSRLDKDGKNEKHFWISISTQEWNDFSDAHKKTKVTNKSGKTVEVAVQRDVLGFLLAKSQEFNAPIDMEEALKFPLSSVPLALAHADGQRRKTNKSSLY